MASTYNLLGSPLTKWYNKPVETNGDLYTKIATIKNVETKNFVLASGEWQAIVSLIQRFCPSSSDAVSFFTPSRSIYNKVSHFLGKTIVELKLTDDFEIDVIALENLLTPNCKLLFINYPNNPTSNAFSREDIYFILNNFNGVVVLDEAFINYSQQKSFLQDIIDYPTLIVLQSFNYAWGLAGLDIALIAGNEEFIGNFKNLKGENAINQPTAKILNEALENLHQVNAMIAETIELKKAFESVLKKFSFVTEVYPSQANFLLVKFNDSNAVYNHLLHQNIELKNCTEIYGCNNCLRITIGTEQQLTTLVDALLAFEA